MVAGLEHTRDYVVQREVQVASGQPLSQQDILDTQSKLYDLGIFSQGRYGGTESQRHRP